MCGGRESFLIEVIEERRVHTEGKIGLLRNVGL